MATCTRRDRHAGSALIEAVLFIVIVSIAAGAMLTLFGGSNRRSAETLLQRQARAVAEAVLNEVRAAPFTFCDPQDANYASALAPAGCASPAMQENLPGGPEAGEARVGGALRFDNVSDYHGLVMAPVGSLDGVAAAGLAGYAVRVTVMPAGAAWNLVPATEVAIITVNVTAPTLNEPVTVTGLRTRHAPNDQDR